MVAERLPALCKAGHPQTPETIYWTGTNRAVRRCRACERGRMAALRPRLQDFAQVCRNGHPRTLANTYTRPDGGRQCRDCTRAANAAGRARQRLLACPRGHPRTPETLYLTPGGRRRCRTCRREEKRRQEERRRREEAARARRSRCRNGHPRTLENTYTRPGGKRECRECNALREAERLARHPRGHFWRLWREQRAAKAAREEARRAREALARGAAERRTYWDLRGGKPARPAPPSPAPVPQEEVATAAPRPLGEVWTAIAVGQAALRQAKRSGAFKDNFKAVLKASERAIEAREREAQEALLPAGGRPAGDLTAAHLLRVVSAATGVPEEELWSREKRAAVMVARHLFFYCAREWLREIRREEEVPLSWARLGQALGRDHTMAAWGWQSYSRRLQTGDQEARDDLREVWLQLRREGYRLPAPGPR